jgi:hypothetical protein
MVEVPGFEPYFQNEAKSLTNVDLIEGESLINLESAEFLKVG